MPVLTLNDIAEVTNLTLQHFEKNKYLYLGQSLTRYVAMPLIMRGILPGAENTANGMKQREASFIRDTVQSGKYFEWPIVLPTATRARNRGIGEVDTVNDTSNEVLARADFRQSDVYWTLDQHRDAANRDPARIVDIVRKKRVESMTMFADLMEANFFDGPDVNDAKSWHGIGHSILRSTSARGFNGQTPTGHTTVYNVNPSTVSEWRNWTGPYTNITDDDLLEELRYAITNTDFRPVISYPQIGNGSETRWMFTNDAVSFGIRRIMRQNNDRLGTDLDYQAGNERFRGIPIVSVPYITNNAGDNTQIGYGNPVYGINFDKFRVMLRAGFDFRERPPQQAPYQHNTFITWIDVSGNFVNLDRRSHFVVSDNA